MGCWCWPPAHKQIAAKRLRLSAAQYCIRRVGFHKFLLALNWRGNTFCTGPPQRDSLPLVACQTDPLFARDWSTIALEYWPSRCPSVCICVCLCIYLFVFRCLFVFDQRTHIADYAHSLITSYTYIKAIQICPSTTRCWSDHHREAHFNGKYLFSFLFLCAYSHLCVSVPRLRWNKQIAFTIHRASRDVRKCTLMLRYIYSEF